MQFVWLYLAVINAVALILYGLDKRFAKRGTRRIPERTLLLSAFFGGALGAAIGMLLFRHKTKKPKFLVLVPIALVLWIVTVILLFRIL
ncbi:MAG: DUF1294 domain-containing protein [Clostridia bacterium]|nr:DUF1294 domain-containing protein [Clostridia bacterium]